jgi:hypothetical protein
VLVTRIHRVVIADGGICSHALPKWDARCAGGERSLGSHRLILAMRRDRSARQGARMTAFDRVALEAISIARPQQRMKAIHVVFERK